MKVVNRIKKNQDFALTINKGQAFRYPSYLIYVKQNELGYTRVGISASKKLGNAVTRNRVKRQTRAIVDSLVDYNKYALDIVIILKLKFLEKDFDDNKSQFSDFMKTQVGL
ncbi:MAG: ribonuclease P protein component [Bacilli bacterium]|nr:ribonuclease P protein component [Bacilli bacterium]